MKELAESVIDIQKGLGWITPELLKELAELVVEREKELGWIRRK